MVGTFVVENVEKDVLTGMAKGKPVLTVRPNPLSQVE